VSNPTAVDNVTVTGPKDEASVLGLVFSTTITNVTPKWDHDAGEEGHESTPDVFKTLILSAWNNTNWYSQTDTNANSKIHPLGDGETYWNIYQVVVDSNYSTFDAKQKEEIDYELTNSAGEAYGKKFTVTFAGKAADETITHQASCFLIDANNMSTSTAPSGTTSISFNLRDWAATSGTGALNHGSVTKYLVVYVDGTAANHTADVVAGVEGTAAIGNIL